MTSTMIRITVSELCEREEVSRSVLMQLVEYDIANPYAGSSVEDWVFEVSSVSWMKRAIRLQRDLDIDWMAVAVLIDLLREREQLCQENDRLRQRLGRFLLEDS